MAAHRYWQLSINSSGFGGGLGTWVAIAELQGIEIFAGPNVLIGGTASCAQGSYSPPTFTPDKAFDGNPNTAWIKDSPAYPIKLKYDLGVGVTKDIKQISVAGRNDGFPSQAPTSADWQWSDDDITYTTYFSYTTPAYTTNGQTQTFGILPTNTLAAQYPIIGVQQPMPAPQVQVAQMPLIGALQPTPAAQVQVAQMVVIGVVSNPHFGQIPQPFGLPCWSPCQNVIYMKGEIK